MSYTLLSDIYSQVRYRTRTSSTSNVATDANLLRLANKYFRKLTQAFFHVAEDYYAEISVFDLRASTSGLVDREYTITADSGTSGGGAYKILRLEAALDGTNWRVIEPTDTKKLPHTPLSSESDITSNFNNQNPKYDVLEDSYFIYSGTISAGTSKGRLWFIRRPAELTASSNSLIDSTYKLPNEFIDVLEDGMVADVYEALGLVSKARIIQQQFNEGLVRVRELAGRRQTEKKLSLRLRQENYGQQDFGSKEKQINDY